ncbi:hypothetical protein [Noviherbaspirillum pedocola]|uniref:Uncharacterized protein n=1 Tax=Noviherbaspirillum pedocola TaxID=2801341 RepID=A0A934SV92_9BURK|nr:hypothetical protein [Noviherbaspirillum pedocola]MBK4736055.1 hypothetical protein [Noviherbaspirillum pedocola]
MPSKDEIIRFAEQHYIEHGYLNQGFITPACVAREFQIRMAEAVTLFLALEADGLLKRRNCNMDWTFELPVARRRCLIDENDLAQLWDTNGGRCFYPSDPQYGEITKVMAATAPTQPAADKAVVIYGFGEAPRAKALGYTMKEVIHGTPEDIRRKFHGEDVIAVTGAALHGKPHQHEYAIFRPGA